MTCIFSPSEPGIALEKMLTQSQVKMQLNKPGMNSTSKSTDINQGMPRLITF